MTSGGLDMDILCLGTVQETSQCGSVVKGMYLILARRYGLLGYRAYYLESLVTTIILFWKAVIC